MSDDSPVPSTSENTNNQDNQDVSLAERELALKEREATLKEIETKYRLSLEKRNVWFTSPLLIAIFSALFGILGTAVGSILQGYWNFQLERQKFEFSLIQKSLETEDDRLIGNHGDRQEAARRLVFLVDSGIIESLDSNSIRKSAENPEQLPTFKVAQVKFVCKSINDTPTTVVQHSNRGVVPYITWKSDYVGSPEKRCNEVSNKLQEAYDKGILNYLTTGTVDGKPFICASSDISTAGCEYPLFQVKPSVNPLDVLSSLNRINTGQQSESYIVE